MRPHRAVPLLALLLAACVLQQPPAAPPLPPLPPPPSLPPANGSLWHPELAGNYPLLDVRAHFPGDLLTVVVDEESKGKKDATTEGTRTSSIAASVDDFFGIPIPGFLSSGFNPSSIVTAQTKLAHTGEGTTSREGTLTASITVTVVGVEPGGTLRVQGDKVVTVNYEAQHIVLTGRVRPEDIASDNSIPSSRIADARIGYYGRGVVAEQQIVGAVQRLFNWVWPF
jgi:flagellar L-ring protein FlgH